MLTASDELRRRFGYFHIAAGRRHRDLGSLFGARWSETAGVWWQLQEAERGPGPGLWVAIRAYEEMTLRWWTPRRRLDRRRKELTSIVEAALVDTGRSTEYLTPEPLKAGDEGSAKARLRRRPD